MGSVGAELVHFEGLEWWGGGGGGTGEGGGEGKLSTSTTEVLDTNFIM